LLKEINVVHSTRLTFMSLRGWWFSRCTWNHGQWFKTIV